jgi:hypothetical protein
MNQRDAILAGKASELNAVKLLGAQTSLLHNKLVRFTIEKNIPCVIVLVTSNRVSFFLNHKYYTNVL